MFKKLIGISSIIFFLLLIKSCRKDPAIPSVKENQGKKNQEIPWTYDPSPHSVALPQHFEQNLPPLPEPPNNPMTQEGVKLGRHLFYDPILSGDNTQACGDCHSPSASFSDSPNAVSTGIDGQAGHRNTMALFNLAWSGNLNWHGSASSLEAQAFEPVTNPVEMHEEWPNAVSELKDEKKYQRMFYEAFGVQDFDSTHVTKAIAQFERTIISGNSKFDQYLLGEANLTSSQMNGFAIFMSESKGDCFHCHGDAQNPLWTDDAFHNNGMDMTFTDPGLIEVTGNPSHEGLFKTPSLRNLAFTDPYMHDGRFQTLDEVIDHYSEGLVHSPTIDPLMKSVDDGGVHLTQGEKDDLKAFLLSLTDSSFVNEPAYQKPPGL